VEKYRRLPCADQQPILLEVLVLRTEVYKIKPLTTVAAKMSECSSYQGCSSHEVKWVCLKGT